MKKLTAFLLGLIMVLSLAACSSENSPAADTPNSSTQENSTATSGESSDETSSQADSSAAGAGNTLVVCFSATGNTEEAVGYIAEITGEDLFALEPADPYTDEDLNYNNDDSRASREHEDVSLRDVPPRWTTCRPGWTNCICLKEENLHL